MIDSGATIALNAADTKSVAKSGLKNGKGNDGEGKNGFSDALSSLKAGPQQKKPGAGDDKTAVDVQASPVTDDDALQLALPDEDAVLPETPLPTPTAKPPAKPSAHLQPLVATETPVETAEPTVAEPAADKKLDASKAAKLAEAGKDVLQLAKAIVDADLTPATLPQFAADAAPATASVKKTGEVSADDEVSTDKADMKDVMDMLSSVPAPVADKPVARPQRQSADSGHAVARTPDAPVASAAASDLPASEAKAVELPTETTDKTFRFSRADGRGQSFDMTIVGRQKDSGDGEAEPAGPVENVTVLDARRYLGLAPDTNKSTIVSTIAGDPEWSAALHSSSALSNAAAQASTGRLVNTLKIQMHPVDLGLVTATLRLIGENLTVDLQVETGAGYRHLKDDQSSIIDALRAQGFSVDQVSVTYAASDKQDSAAGQQNAQNGASNQSSAQGNGQGSAAGREENFGAPRSGGQQGWSSDDAAVEIGTVAAAGGARPDHVYI